MRAQFLPLALAGLFLSISALAAEPDMLTPAEAADVDGLARKVEQQCKTQAAVEKSKAAGPKDPYELTPDNHYCGCIGQRIRARATPALVRNGTAADVQNFEVQAERDCGAQAIKDKFPALCHSWTKAAPGSAAAEKMDRACACAQKRVDRITGETVAETLRQAKADYDRYRRGPDQPKGGASCP